VDYAVNVNLFCALRDRWRNCQKHFRQLVVMLASMPSSPAVVDLETYHPMKGRYCNDNVTRWNPWEVAVGLDIPVWSYLDGVCHEGHTFWVLRGADMYDDTHPGQVTHDLIARMVVGIFAQEVDGVCAGGEIGEETQAVGAGVGVSAPARCLARPLTDALAKRDGRGGFILAGIDKAAWAWRGDIKLWRQGFGATPGRVGDIGFIVATGQGYIQVEYVGSPRADHVTCQVDEREPRPGNSCTLPGWWPSDVPQSRFFYMKTNRPPGQHVLWCRSDGKSFKIWGIAAC